MSRFCVSLGVRQASLVLAQSWTHVGARQSGLTQVRQRIYWAQSHAPTDRISHTPQKVVGITAKCNFDLLETIAFTLSCLTGRG